MDKKKKRLRPGTLPAITNNCWEVRSAPLVLFIKEARNWFELAVWAKSNKVGGYLLRNYLAYLEYRGLAEALPVRVKATGKIIWIWRQKNSSNSELFSGYEVVDPAQIYSKDDIENELGGGESDTLCDDLEDEIDDL